ncbi:MAG: Ig-like domain repeat protein [Terracidiphilus sp.]
MFFTAVISTVRQRIALNLCPVEPALSPHFGSHAAGSSITPQTPSSTNASGATAGRESSPDTEFAMSDCRPLSLSVVSPCSAFSSFANRKRSPRFGVLLPGLVVLASLLLPTAARAQTITAGGAITVAQGQTAAGSSTATVSGAPGPVATVKVELLGVTSDGQNCCNSMGYAEFMLQSPSGEQFVLLSSTGDGIDGCDENGNFACDGLHGMNITIEDGAAAAPNGAGALGGPGSWLTADAPYTVKPSSYYQDNIGTYPPLPTSTNVADYPQTDGSATLTGKFNGVTANGTWTLYIIDNNTPPDPISITGWTLSLTYSTATPTTTTLSSSASNPAYYANSASSISITYTATVHSGTGTPTGTVTFSANGSTISGCNAVALSSGVAQCTVSLAQGNNSIVAQYTPSGAFGQSSSSMTQLVEVTAANPSGNQWCNNSLILVPANDNPGLSYPSIIGISDSSYNSKTVANVTVELEGIQGLTDGISGQFLLVAPGGTQDLVFLQAGFNDTAPTSAVNLTFEDSASGYVPYNSGTPTTGAYLPTDNNEGVNPDTFATSTSPSVDSSVPQVPGTLNFAAPYGTDTSVYTHTNVLTFGKAFNGASANGKWALYTVGPYAVNLNNGWCITLTLNTGVATSTALTPSSNPATTGQPVTFTATVTSGGDPVTSGGTVTFLDNNATPAGTVSGNNVVTLNGSGVATFTTSSLSEGDHSITASYSGTGSDNSSYSSTLYQRINTATTVTQVSSTVWQYCNPGAVQGITADPAGPLTPNPSVITVSNLPGTLNTVTVQLTNFSVSAAENLDQLASLVEGPSGAALDFFSNTTQGASGYSEANLGNYIFEDSASSEVPVGSGSSSNYYHLSVGSYKPTAYESFLDAPDSFTSSTSGFYPAPTTFSYAAPTPLGSSSTFADVFTNGSNANGKWRLFFSTGQSSPQSTMGAANGWCVNLTENLPTVSVDASHTGTFTQGQQGAQLTATVTSNGPGSTGDPSGSHPLTVTDTLPTGLSYANSYSGSGWSCSGSGGTVTCTNDSSIGDGDQYPALTIDVNVADNAPATVNNSESASGGGASNTPTSSDSITINPAPVLSVTKSHTGTFTQGSTAQWNISVSNTVTGSTTSGTVSVSDTLPTGYTLASYTGSGWTCGGTTTVSCSSTQMESGGSSFPVIQVIVNVPANSPKSVSNTALAWGGGDFTHTGLGTAATSNTDSVTVVQVPASIAVSSGGTQSTAISTAFSTPMMVTVTDAAGNPINNSPVTFTAPSTGASGTFNNSSTTITVTTSSSGVANAGTFTANSNTGAYSVTASVSGLATPATFSLTNAQAPSITSANSATFIVNSPVSFTVTTTGYPAVNLTVTNVLNAIPGVTIPSSGTGTIAFSGTPTAPGTETFTITASNGFGTAATQNFTLTVNQAPSITSANNATFITGTAGSFTVTANGYPTPTISETGTLPSGVTFSAGTFSGTPAAGTGGSYPFTITASNGVSPNATQSFSLIVDQAPAFTSGGSTTFTVGTSGSFTVTATSYPAPTFAVTAGTLPSGVTFSAGVLSGTPAAGTGGSYPITITASNSISPNATQSFTLTVDQAPSITSTNNATFIANSPVSFTVTTTGYPAVTLTVSNIQNAIPGVTIPSSGSGTITFSGTPTASGTETLTITASNGVGAPVTQNFTLTVNYAPSITSVNNATFTTGTAGTFTVTSNGIPTPTLSETGTLPSGVSFTNNGNGTATLSGTPVAGTGGSYPFTITASNGVSPNATQSFSLIVDQAPAFTSANNTTFALDASGSFSITTSPGYPGPATLSVTNVQNAIPGVTIPSSGTGTISITGTPTATGTETFTITATNGAGLTASQNFTLTVDQPPAFTSASSTTFEVNVAGSFSITTSPGFPTNAASLAVSNIQNVVPGVTVPASGTGSITISGTPTASGTETFTTSATNSAGLSASPQNFTLTVVPHVSISPSSCSTFTVGTPASCTMTGSGGAGAITLTVSNVQNAVAGLVVPSSGTGSLAIGGTPTASGTETFTLTATDSLGGTYVQNYTLTVLNTQVQIITAANPAGGGTVTPPSGSLYNVGTVVSLQAIPATGYTFLNWTSSPDAVASATSASTTIPMNSAESVTASFAPNLVVTTNNDDSGTTSNCTVQATPGTGTDASCSLRDALLNAAGAGSGNITFDSKAFATAQTITTGSTLTIPANTTIQGRTSGSGVTLTNLVTVAGGGSSSNFSVFTVNSGVTGATINNLTITNGNTSGSGGGIMNSGTLTVSNSTVSDNTASFNGGGIMNPGKLTVSNSTFSGNATSNGGGIYSLGTLTVSNSTFSGNTASVDGGGIDNWLTLTVSNSTFSGNTAKTNGGGIDNGSGLERFTRTVSVTNSIFISNLSENGNGAGINNSVPGGNANADSNVYYQNTGKSGEDDCNGCTTNTNAVSGNPMLAVLANYGGPTQTMMPLPGSLAICEGTVANATAAGLTVDQRGFGFVSTYCPAGYVDSGAVQTNYALSFTTDPGASQIAGVPFTTAVTLTESASPVSGVTIPLTLNGGGTLSGGSASTNLSGVASYTLTVASSTALSGLTLMATLPSPPSLTTNSSSFSLSALAVPTVTGISPSSGSTAGGTTVTITGTNFTGATAVDFGSTPATNVTVINSATTTATSPAGVGTVDVTVTTPGGTSATSPVDQYTYSKAAATVTLGSLAQTYTGSALSATATTTPVGLTVTFTYNGLTAAPTAATTG